MEIFSLGLSAVGVVAIAGLLFYCMRQFARQQWVLNQLMTAPGQSMQPLFDSLRRQVGDDVERLRGAQETLDRELRRVLTEAGQQIGITVTGGQKQVSEVLQQAISGLRLEVTGLRQEISTTIGGLHTLVGEKLDVMRQGNEAKLAEIQGIVNEQLQTALEKKVTESFQQVIVQFAEVQKTMGDVQAVTGQISDIKRLFSNVKTRGGWGESQLQQVLDDILPPGAYEINLAMQSGERVEYALRMPVRGDVPIWLPIDAKFPVEAYDALVLAAEAGDRDAEQAARKALSTRILGEAKRIQTKYIRPPFTTEYAVMFLPTEGLYYEVSRIAGLVERCRRDHNVWIVGPSLLPAMLQCIRVGHLTLALESNAGAIGKTLGAVKATWTDMVRVLDKVGDRADSLTTQIGTVATQARKVDKALRTIDMIEFEQAKDLLGVEQLDAA